MSCAKSVLPAYMAVSTGKPARLPCHSVQVDTAHLPPQTQSISRSPRHDPSVNRTAVISGRNNDDWLEGIGDSVVPRAGFDLSPGGASGGNQGTGDRRNWRPRGSQG